MVCWSASYNPILWQIRQNPKMNSILPILALVLSWTAWSTICQAQTPLSLDASNQGVASAAAAPATGGVSAEALVRHVIANLDAQPSIAAKVRHRVDLLDRTLIGSGVYLQQGRGPGRVFRFELELQMNQQQGSVRQVCDGTKFWLAETLGDDTSLIAVDVARLNRARPKSAPAPSAPIGLTLGGIPKLLANLDNVFVFDTIVESRLEDLRVWSLEGQWKRPRLIQMLPDQKDAIEAGKPSDLKKLAPNMPERVVLHVGVDDGFPYRIEYWKSDPKRKDDKSREDDRLLVLLEFYEVKLGAKIDPLEFAFDPKGVKPIDRTVEYLDRLGLEETAGAGANRGPTPRR
jgi:hypothetical protein